MNGYVRRLSRLPGFCVNGSGRLVRGALAPRVVGVGAVLISAIAPQVGNAALVENLTIGNAKALALGNAVTADPPGVDSIHFNPAGLARLDGRMSQVKLLGAAFQFDAQFGAYHPDAQEQIDYWGVGPDDIPGQKSSTSTAVVKLPFMDKAKEWPLPFVVAPLGGVAYRPPESKLTFATSVYVPFAAGYKREDDDPARYMGKYLSVVRLSYLTPSVGWRVNDELSLGFSVGLSWQGIGANTDLRVPNLVLGAINRALEEIQTAPLSCSGIFGVDADVCDPNTPLISPLQKAAEVTLEVSDPYTWSTSFGVLWSPTPWFTWGASYMSESNTHMTGDYRMEYSDVWVQPFSRLSSSQSSVAPLWNFLGLPKGLAHEEGKVKINLDIPAQFNTGVSVKLTPVWKVNFDAHWMDWSKWDGLVFEFDRKTDFLRIASVLQPEYATQNSLTIPRHYRSVWNFSLGVEYQFSDPLALRIGVEDRKSSIGASKYDLLLPLGEAYLFGTGFEYRPDRNSIWEMSVGYVLSRAKIPAGSSTNLNSMDTAHNFIYNPYSGMDVETKAQGLLLNLNYSSQF
ncbi:conserved hypothetical protein [gamma proteobacterium HdN1]|nr:conserved hypothetical protein [gamma proteobacterium HdN1]